MLIKIGAHCREATCVFRVTGRIDDAIHETKPLENCVGHRQQGSRTIPAPLRLRYASCDHEAIGNRSIMANDSGTKAYVLRLGEALHEELQKFGLHVSVLLPSPTATPVLAEFGFDPDTMPMRPMSVEQCVDEGLAALNANRASHVTGRMYRILTALLPRSMMIRMNGNMLAKAVAGKRARAERPS